MNEENFFVIILKMYRNQCSGDFLIYDFTFLLLRWSSKKIIGNEPNTSVIFIIRCFLGLVFDATEYGILTATVDNIHYDCFKFIFIVYSIFVVFLFVNILCGLEVIFSFFFSLYFKSLRLSVAIFIYETAVYFSFIPLQLVSQPEILFETFL